MASTAVRAGLAAAFAVAASAGPHRQASAESVLRVGMTVADLPLTTWQASQGSEGTRFNRVGAMRDTVLDPIQTAPPDLEALPPGCPLAPHSTEARTVHTASVPGLTHQTGTRAVKRHREGAGEAYAVSESLS